MDCGLEGAEPGLVKPEAEQGPSQGLRAAGGAVWVTDKGGKERSGVAAARVLCWKCHCHLHFTGQKASPKAKPDVHGAGIPSLL